MATMRIHSLSTITRIILAVFVAAAAHAQTSVPVRHSPFSSSSIPPEMRSGLSSALGQDSSLYRIRAMNNGHDAAIPSQHLAFHFNSEGVDVNRGTTHWRMAMRGYGYGEAIEQVSAAFPEANQNRIAYRRRDLTEWYVNGPLGLEQGFTISQPPRGTRTGFLTVAMTLSGDLRPAVNQNADGFVVL